jgi:transposase
MGRQLHKSLKDRVKQHLGVELWVQDEIRLGLRENLGRKITSKGVKPLGKQQPRYEYRYLYGLLNPVSGQRLMVEAEAMQTAFFQFTLNELANTNPLFLKVVLLDNAAIHKAKALKIPANIFLCFLPPYNPELNPTERFWEAVRRPLKNRYFQTLEEMQVAVRQTVDSFSNEEIRSLTFFPYLQQALNQPDLFVY